MIILLYCTHDCDSLGNVLRSCYNVLNMTRVCFASVANTSRIMFLLLCQLYYVYMYIPLNVLFVHICIILCTQIHRKYKCTIKYTLYVLIHTVYMYVCTNTQCMYVCMYVCIQMHTDCFSSYKYWSTVLFSCDSMQCRYHILSLCVCVCVCASYLYSGSSVLIPRGPRRSSSAILRLVQAFSAENSSGATTIAMVKLGRSWNLA